MQHSLILILWEYASSSNKGAEKIFKKIINIFLKWEWRVWKFPATAKKLIYSQGICRFPLALPSWTTRRSELVSWGKIIKTIYIRL